MDTTHESSDADNNEISSHNHKLPEQSPSTPPPSEKKYDIVKDPIFLTSPVYPPLISPKDSISTQRDDYLIPILSNETKITHSTLNSHLCLWKQLTTPSNYMTQIKPSSLLLPR